MLACPLCSHSVANPRGLASHFRHQAATHPDYETWFADREWAGKAEPQDYVTCLECGLRAPALTGHLRTHQLTAETYRTKHGASVQLRSLGSSAVRNASLQGARGSASYEGQKFVFCPSCGASHEVHKLSAPTLCPSCIGREETALWEGKTEPQDYVSCLECSYRAENLMSHLQSSHPGYRERHSNARVVALGSAVRDKTLLKGVPPSDETRLLMSKNAGRWNAGFTKANSSSLKAQSEKMLGKPSWSKGLTSQNHPSLQSTSEKLKLYIGENRPWHNGLRVDLTLEDVRPLLDEQGRVDRQKAFSLDLSWHVVQKYMSTYGLEISDVNVKARAEAQVIRLTSEELLPYRLKNGKLVVAWAAKRLGYGTSTISREADRLGIPRLTKLQQGACLGAVSEALDGLPWVEEWRDTLYRNPVTGHRYKFDGYFEDVGLIVEYHGYQHFIYPNAYHKTEEDFLDLRRRDAHKKALIKAAPGKHYLEVRYDQPFDDPVYLRGRLFEILYSERDGIHAQDLPAPDTLDMLDVRLPQSGL